MVELVQIDLVDLERAQADVAMRAKGFGAAVDREVVAVAPVTSLGRDQRTFASDSTQSARHDLLRVGFGVGARVGERGIDEPHPGVQSRVHGRRRVLCCAVPEGELRRSEPDPLDATASDQHPLSPLLTTIPAHLLPG